MTAAQALLACIGWLDFVTACVVVRDVCADRRKS